MKRTPSFKSLMLVIALSFSAMANIFAQVNLKTPVNFTVRNSSIPNALHQLTDAYKVNLAFSNQIFVNQKNITLDCQAMKLEDVLNLILKNTDVDYKFQNEQLILFRKRESLAKKKLTINGYVAEETNGEKLIGVNVFHKPSGKWATTNEYGFYSITIPEGKTDLTFSYLGCEEHREEVQISKSHRIDVSLKSAKTLTEIIVMPSVDSAALSSLTENGQLIPPNYVSIAPGIGGEVDVINMATTLPGVQTGADGFGGLYVRGGEAGQNLMLLDGVPIYNPGHLLGIFSVYNTDAIRSATLLKGQFPARYGGRVSSVFDVRSKEGNLKKWTAEFGAGLISARTKVEGPIFNKKGGILLAFRRSHSPFLIDNVLRSDLFQSSGDYKFKFYDLNAKIHFNISKKDKLFLSYYSGRDVYGNGFSNSSTFLDFETEEFFQYKEIQQTELNWGNAMAAFRWNRIWGAKLFSNTTLTYSKYDYQSSKFYEASVGSIELESISSFTDQRTGIEDYALKTDFEYLPGNGHVIRFGANVIAHQLSPYTLSSENEAIGLPDSLGFDELTDLFVERITRSIESAVYIEDEFQLSDKININGGLRLSGFLGERGNFYGIEPRLNGTYEHNSKWTFRGGMSRMVQYLQQIPTSGLSLPSDIWLSATDSEPPLRTWIFEAGTSRKITNKLQVSVDGFYKKMNGILAPESPSLNSTISINPDFSIDGLIKGSGSSYGLELLLQKQGKTGGWLSYSLANTTRNFEELRGGRSFSFRFNRLHTLNIFAFHQFNEHWHVSANWRFGSASPQVRVEGLSGVEFFPGFEEPEEPINLRTEEKGKPYHRLDINVNYQFNWLKTKHVLKFGAFNLYNRSNPAYYTLSYNFRGQPVSRPVSLLKFMPSLYYSVGF